MNGVPAGFLLNLFPTAEPVGDDKGRRLMSTFIGFLIEWCTGTHRQFLKLAKKRKTCFPAGHKHLSLSRRVHPRADR